MKRTYSNDKITVYWDSDKCIKSGECDGRLPRVFDVTKRPWVNLDAADVEEIKRVIDTCPSGALSYVVHDQPASDAVTIQVMKNGPYKVAGRCKLMAADGKALAPGKSLLCAVVETRRRCLSAMAATMMSISRAGIRLN